MALYFDLPVYKTTYQLLLEIHRIGSHVPRDIRYTLLSRLSTRLEECIAAIYEANATRNKVPVLTSLRKEMVRVDVELRLLCDLKAISQNQYVVMIEQSNSISKQLLAWQRAEIQNANLPKEASRNTLGQGSM